jgi:hypothetical protein
MHSCLYVGQVEHERLTPVRNRFRYGLYMVFLDLSELKTVFQNYLFWSTSLPNLAWFRRADHLGDISHPLEQSVRDLVQERLGFRPTGPIRLLTQLRHFGFVMNPVSFYFCYNDQHELQALVAEVNNTPWGEQHCYVFAWPGSPTDTQQTWHEPKQFHVSPFMPMDMTYHWEVTAPGAELRVKIKNYDVEGQAFWADLKLRRYRMNRWQLWWASMRYPWISVLIFLRIYWQAFILWWKGVPYVPHP